MALPLARPVLRNIALQQARAIGKNRYIHVENKVGNNMPFSYSNKRTLALKVSLFLLTGFSIPFVAAAVQLKKAGGAA